VVAVQEEERRRVARELHDEVGQAISAVLVGLGQVENRLPAGYRPVSTRIGARPFIAH